MMNFETTTVYYDLDGTLVDLYGVENWLDYLIAEDTFPYDVAEPLVNFSLLARTIHQLQRNGIRVGIISWLSKNGSDEYNRAVTISKQNYLKKHLPSVEFDEIHIVKYGTPKSSCATSANSILFDDEERNRNEWCGRAFSEKNLIENLRLFL